MRKAIALIELIFAIVVIGISLISIPNLIGLTTKSSSEAFTQEAISNGFSYMGMILSQYWDNNLVNSRYSDKILYVKDGDSELNESINSYGMELGVRVGSPLSSSRKFAKDTYGDYIFSTDNTSLGFEPMETTPNDIDDFNNLTKNLLYVETTTPESGDYKDSSIDITTTVNYISDYTEYNKEEVKFNNPFNNIVNGSTNIKMITLKISTPNNPDKVIIFRGFSCNIGSEELEERIF